MHRSTGDVSSWSFDHPPRGTCHEGCTMYARCHCGCGQEPRVSKVTYETGDRYRGEPYVFVAGHHIRLFHPRAGAWSRNGVPVEKIRPLLLWLRSRHGSVRATAAILRIPEATVRGYMYNRKRRHVPPDAASAIVSLVLAHRKASDPLSSWEEPPGLLETERMRVSSGR